ncbi:MAG: efflux RND transporter periplasmic adaptor subunit [Desulfobacterales bacterium]|nr:efflux RND transporter periplasmic adaptor subunit [Desulfobacterales bacterium]
MPLPTRSVAEAKVALRDIEQSISRAGVVIHTRLYDIRSPLTGRVKASPIREGQMVNPGDLLCTFESGPLLDEKATALLDLKLARNRLESLEGEQALERESLDLRLWELGQEFVLKEQGVFSFEKQFERGMISRADLAKKKSELDLLKKQQALAVKKGIRSDRTAQNKRLEQEYLVRSAEKKVAELEARIKSVQVFSPITGRIIEISEALPGFRLSVNQVYLTQGEKICQIAVGDKKGVKVLLRPETVAQVSSGDRVLIKPGKPGVPPVGGVIARIGTGVQKQGSVKFPVFIETIDRSIDLPAGVGVQCRIRMEKKIQVLSIPIDFIDMDGDRAFCHVRQNGQLLKKAIDTGIDDGRFVEIVKGLQVGEQVVKKQGPEG